MVRVNVIGGKASQDDVPSRTMVTITADPPKEGMMFVGFRDEKGDLITQDEVFSFVVTEDVYLEAVYEKIEVPEPGNSNQPSLRMYQVRVSRLFLLVRLPQQVLLQVHHLLLFLVLVLIFRGVRL